MKYNPNLKPSQSYLTFTRCHDLKSFFDTWPEKRNINGKWELMKDYLKSFFEREDIKDFIENDDFINVFKEFRKETHYNVMILVHFFYICGINSVDKITKEEGRKNYPELKNHTFSLVGELFGETDLDIYFEE